MVSSFFTVIMKCREEESSCTSLIERGFQRLKEVLGCMCSEMHLGAGTVKGDYPISGFRPCR